MTAPRMILPGRFYLVSRRCTQRQFLLRPDTETNNAFVYCLAVAADRLGIEVLLTCAMSNHHHTVVFDRYGTLPAFTEQFHKLLAKCQNALRGRSENVWAAEQVSTVPLDGEDSILRAMVYAATNPVKDGLVERVHHWPGVNSWTSLRMGRPVRATRPRHYFSSAGEMPSEVSLQLVLPAELGDVEVFLADLRRHIAAKEEEILNERRKTGARVQGRQSVLRQSWRASSVTTEQRKSQKRQLWSGIVPQRIDRGFLVAYRTARASWGRGLPIPFPAGTYWLRRHAYVPIVDDANRARDPAVMT